MRRFREQKQIENTDDSVFSRLNWSPADSLNFLLYELNFLETRHGNTEYINTE